MKSDVHILALSWKTIRRMVAVFRLPRRLPGTSYEQVWNGDFDWATEFIRKGR